MWTMSRYVIRYMDEALLELVNLPCQLELQARRKLIEIARCASNMPAPGDPRWREWQGVDLWSLDFEISGVRVVYALDTEDHAVVVRRIEQKRPARPKLKLVQSAWVN